MGSIAMVRAATLVTTASLAQVEIGVKIAYAMLSKLRRDLLAGMDTVSHEQERVHQLDHRLADDVRSPLRHVRTRLYFTSESHIHSAFNVLRWGHQYARAPGGQPCLSIFSEEARAMFDEWALGYLTQLLFRVLYRKGEDETRPSSYTVQILVSPGVSLSDVDSVYEGSVFAPEEDLSEPQVHTEPLLISSRRDLTLEDVDLFLDSLGCNLAAEVADPHRPPTSTPDNCISPDIARRVPAPPHTVGSRYSRGGAQGSGVLPPRFDAAAAAAPAAAAPAAPDGVAAGEGDVSTDVSGAPAGEWGELAPDAKRETPHPSEAARGQSPPTARCVGVGCPVV